MFFYTIRVYGESNKMIVQTSFVEGQGDIMVDGKSLIDDDGFKNKNLGGSLFLFRIDDKKKNATISMGFPCGKWSSVRVVEKAISNEDIQKLKDGILAVENIH